MEVPKKTTLRGTNMEVDGTAPWKFEMNLHALQLPFLEVVG